MRSVPVWQKNSCGNTSDDPFGDGTDLLGEGLIRLPALQEKAPPKNGASRKKGEK